MEEIYGVATAIRPEVMNDAIADYLLPIDGKCLSLLPVHLQTPERMNVAVETSGISAIDRGGVKESLRTPEIYVGCTAHSWQSFAMIPWAERSPEICLLAKKLYPEQTAKRPDLIPESVKNGCNVYSLCKMMEVRTGEKFTYQQMTDFYNGKPLDVKRMETPDGVQKDKAVRFDKEKQDFSFSAIRQERKKGLRM